MTAIETSPRTDTLDEVPSLSPVAVETKAEEEAALAAAAAADQPAAAREARTSHVVLKHVDVWSVFKLSLVFYLCVCAVLLVAGIVLWTGASAAGIVGNVESFFQDAGFDGFEFTAGALLKAFAVIGLILVVAGTVANLLLAQLFNLLSDLVGGIRFTLREDLKAKR